MKVAIVGAGIFGLAHAWSAAKRGHHVTVIERSPRASGASIRNFGMVWPIGQTSGHWHKVALRSRQAWIELASLANIWFRPCGSIHLAHRPDELRVLQEFAELGPGLGYECQFLSPEEVLAKTPAANPRGLLGGLFSASECSVNPPTTIRAIAPWLTEHYGVQFRFHTAACRVDGRTLILGNGDRQEFERCVICSGSDLQTLYADVFASSGIRQCKLQMLRTRAQPAGWQLGTHLASGLTLRHYACFEACPSLTALRQRVANETPELDRFGIHVMASQNELGEVILGDSHEYDDDIEPFDKQLIDELMLRELQKIISLPDWTLGERWHGIYCKHTQGPVFCAEPEPGVYVRSGAGGSGMTMAFGLAEEDWDQWS